MKLQLLLSGFCALNFAACQEPAKLTASIKTVEDNGRPVPGVTIDVNLFERWQPGEGFGKDIMKQLHGVTDRDGIFHLSSRSPRGIVAFSAKMAGFYDSFDASYQFQKVENNQWMPVSPCIELKLRRKQNPTALCVKWVAGTFGQPIILPVFGKPVGYDLAKGDWMPPYGTGVQADILLQLDGQTENLEAPYESKFLLRFPNKHDGIRMLDKNEINYKSQMRMPFLAPVDGYVSDLRKRKAVIRAPKGNSPGPDTVYEDDTKENECYFLRTRTLLDDGGNIYSAHYAKIQGGFQWDATGALTFRYYFNPVSNDRNLEFDPKRNLFKLPAAQEINDP